VASVAEDDSIALRLRFFGPVPRPEQMYFRGPVLSTFDGREWTRLVPNFPVDLRPRLNLQLRGQPLKYEMTLEPSRLPLLPLLEMTPDLESSAPRVEGWRLTLRPDGQWQTDRAVSERLRVTASASLEHRHGPTQDVVGLRDLVALPPNANPRTLEWAARLRARADLAQADATQLSEAVLRHIRENDYTYTLEPGTYGADAIDDFWLNRKLGFCEHFASAYVVVMRAMDVPSRIVTGYQGTDPEPQDGYWTVRQRNAHAWAEYWQAGSGWIRVDPTAAVAPERVLQGRSLRAPPGFVGGAISSLNPQLAGQLRAIWENANNRWNQWVLNYARGQQMDLLKALGFEAPSWRDLSNLLILLLCSASLLGAGWAWWDRRRQDPWQRLQKRITEQLAKRGVVVALHHAPRERAARVRAALGPQGAAAAEMLDGLDRQRYASAGRVASPGRDWLRRFKLALRAAG